MLIKTYVDVAKFVIWADSEDGNNSRARLVFSFRDGMPRMTVYTGVTGPGGVISFPSDYPTMSAIMVYLKEVANGEAGGKMLVETLTNVYENNVATSAKKVVSTLHIGKSKEGVVYLSILSDSKNKIIFTIKPGQYTVFRDSEKNIIPNSIISVRMAIGIADMVLNIISSMVVNYTTEEYETVRKPMPIKSMQTATAQSANIVQDLEDIPF